MKIIFRLFFKTLRFVIGPFMLLWEAVSAPRGVVRSIEDQQKIDLQSQELLIYQFLTCPFCIKVRQELRRLSLPVELRDAQKDLHNRASLLEGGGAIKVPCLKITDAQGNSQWLYESTQIIQYLRKRFA